MSEILTKWLSCDEHGVPDWREPHCLFCELAKRAADLATATAALREIASRSPRAKIRDPRAWARRIAARALEKIGGEK